MLRGASKIPITIRLLAAAVCLVAIRPATVYADSFSYKDFTGEITWFQTNFRALDMADRQPLTGSPQFLRLMWNNGYGNDPYLLNRGAVWYTARQTVVYGFTTEFKFRITPPDPGATPAQTWPAGDGFAFVLQNHDVLTIGDGSSDMGYGRIGQGLAVEFDIFKDDRDPAIEPDANHVSVITPVDVNPDDSDPAALYSYAPLAVASVTTALADGAVHTAKIVYDPPARRKAAKLSIYVDRTLVISTTVPALDNYFPSGDALIGFTAGRSLDAGTALRTADEDILSWTFKSQEK